ncbi:hypothetical protein CHLNCDRAFT_53102 [Chlorella variabilis]|uniref:Ribosomal RNA-processing protein 7 C-terminal domain-containing protein n=1 Tax=Chlorella variabilis TaxID=554065 RepID=E1ZIA7_CHLVA|nr:hypothetical protein CHLNCDRAFT_53102 [Chlorella variabilis]EFN54303.1 hypothetical protein CHLNCDRAFT_53102 [Chlorella variabilis]|eukprot:XP_005846405.1 hypothetical protein CHLNCDRAFT_53102 [Chlorella variabilis]
MASTSYKVLPVRLLGPGPATVRYLYIKPHTGEDSLPKDRAVYIAGVPAQLQGTALVELFARYGTIERAALHGSRVSAVLLYAAAEGRDKLLKAAAKGRPLELQLQEPTGPYGLKGEAGGEPGLPWAGDEYRHSRQSHPDGKLTRWVEEHKALKPGNAELQQALDEWMEEWEAEEERRRAEAVKAQEEDGWTVVQRHKASGRKKNASATGVTVGGVAGAAAAAQLQAATKKDATHADFYRFQQREHRRNELLNLRQRFEEDKKRIAELRASRKWRPY